MRSGSFRVSFALTQVVIADNGVEHIEPEVLAQDFEARDNNLARCFGPGGRATMPMRLSYVTWQEPVDPLIVVELLLPGTKKEDLGQTLRDAQGPPTKWDVYERWMRIPYYVTFGRYTDEMKVFRLTGARYQEVRDHQGRFWIPEVKLGLGLWKGDYQGEDRLWLRWYDGDDQWIPSFSERIFQQQQIQEKLNQRLEQESRRAEQERKEKEAALLKAEQLAVKLRELGIDPEQI